MLTRKIKICFAAAIAALAVLLPMACSKVGPAADYKKLLTDSEVPRIEVAEAKRDYDAGTVVIVDSRPESAYQGEHIKGAINIPLGAPDDAFGVLPKDKKIIVYCS